MPWGKRSLYLTAALLACASLLSAQDSALDLDGHAIDPLQQNNGKVTVLVFIRRDCPVSARYAPVIQRIAGQNSRAANFWLVDPDKGGNASQIRKYLADYGYDLPALRDPSHALVKLSRVQITPEVAVFNRDRQLIYEGRIDNRYLDLSRARPAATTHELEDAIHAALAGKTVAQSEVRGIGCYISDLD
jgi:hypothetical protein